MSKRIWNFLYQLSSGQTFCRWVDIFLPWTIAICVITFSIGLIGGLVFAPADYQQGDAFRIIYLHVPSAFLSLMAYSVMTFCAVLSLVWRLKMADVVLRVVPPIGASFAFIALVTGSIWGKPMWGTWWIWDARLTSELILLFLYLGIIGLRQVIPYPDQASRAVAIFTLVGFVDIPLIHYSVNWWNTLHQGATLSAFAKPKMAASMLYPLFAMLIAFISYFASLVLYRTRTEILLRDRDCQWVQKRLVMKE